MARRISTLGKGIVVLTAFVIPNFAPIFRVLGDDLPWATRAVLASSAFIKNHGLALAGGLQAQPRARLVGELGRRAALAHRSPALGRPPPECRRRSVHPPWCGRPGA